MTRRIFARNFLTALLLLQLCAPAAGARPSQNQGAPSVWTPELMMKVRGVGAGLGAQQGGVRVSPDGKRVAYTVTNALMTADRSEFVTQIWLANADGTNAFQLTYADKSSSNPRWSPDGRWLAFTSNRTGKSNIFLLRLDGGEAEQVTDVKTNVTSFAWSPDARSFAFTMPDQLSEDEEKLNKGRDDWRWAEENVKLSRLYVVSLQKDANGKREPRRLTKENYNVSTSDFDWSPDGRAIAFSHTKAPKADYWTTADLSVVDVSTGEVKTLSATPAAEDQPRYSPDGRTIAFSMSDNPPRWARASAVHLMPAAGGTPKALASSFDSQPAIIGWSADGRRLFFNEPRGTGTRLYSVDTNANTIAEWNVKGEVITGIDLNRSRTMMGFTMQSPEEPPEAYVSPVERFAPVRVSSANADAPRAPLGRSEVVRWKSADGKEIEGVLIYPAGYTPGRRVPLLLNIHGGPAGVFQTTYIGSRNAYPIAAFASRGYAVLRPNPRGSSGYGLEFRRANIKDWGGMDYQDLMTGVDHVVKMGVADPERLGVMGWSYGGYMTSWIITQTKRFKAASAGAPVTNLMSFTGTADIPAFIPDYFGAQPWDNIDIYRAHSPMFNVKGVSTPTLIQHGEADDRVPISQGYELYNALRAQGVPARMLVLPRQPHGPNEPKMLLKVMQTNLEWFDKYIGGDNKPQDDTSKDVSSQR